MGEEILAAHECMLESFIAERRGIQIWFYEYPILENAKVSFGSNAPVQHCRKPTLPSVVYQDVVTVSKGRGAGEARIE
ncbi:MAG: hypothetical protein V4563_03555 [Pseudomonadota bacterium]